MHFMWVSARFYQLAIFQNTDIFSTELSAADTFFFKQYIVFHSRIYQAPNNTAKYLYNHDTCGSK